LPHLGPLVTAMLSPSSLPLAGAGKAAKASKSHFKARGEKVPSWEWFEQAASEPVVAYRVEIAKSGRSKCSAKSVKIAMRHNEGELIEKGEIRCGSMDLESGAYGRWFHLECWRVPSLIWLGLPDPEAADDPVAFHEAVMSMQQITMCGFDQLAQEDQETFVAHLMDKTHWAKANKLSLPAHEEAFTAAAAADDKGSKAPQGSRGGAAQIDLGASSSALVLPGNEGPRHFIAPRPGHNGALANALVKKTFVLTGLFPEVGGGAGLNLGKDRLREIIESFGGRVTSAVSGKTDVLVVGQEPGASKVSKAQERGIKQVDVLGLKTALETPGMALEDCPEPLIDTFSAGYRGSALRLAQGGRERKPAKIKAPKAPRAKKAPAKRKAVKNEYEEDEDEDEEYEEPKAKKKAPVKRKRKAKGDNDDDE
jgi:hypothetical protein